MSVSYNKLDYLLVVVNNFENDLNLLIDEQTLTKSGFLIIVFHLVL